MVDKVSPKEMKIMSLDYTNSSYSYVSSGLAIKTQHQISVFTC